MAFIYIKLFLAVIFGWLLYATLIEAGISLYTLRRDKSLTFVDDQIGDRELEWGKDRGRIIAFFAQHLLIAAVFGFAAYLMLA